MQTMSFNRNAQMDAPQIGRDRLQSALTLDQVRRLAPSAFATDKHDSRSDRYAYIPTSRVITAMMDEGFQPFRAQQGSSRIEGKADFTKHMIRFRHASAMTAQVGDSIPEVVLINSHDGTCKYRLIAGIFVIRCTNGLVTAQSTVGDLAVGHTGDVVQKVIEGSFQIIDHAQESLNSVREWSGLQLTNGETHAFAESAHALRFADAEGNVDTPFTADQLLTSHRRSDASNSLWHTFNRIQENALQGGLKAVDFDANGHRRNVTSRAVKSIDGDVKLNRALWQLTQRMAELKGVAA